MEYALPHEKTGRRVFNAPFHEEWQQTLRDEEKVLLMAPVEHAKALPLTTEIPTPTGFRPLSAIKEGDTIYSSSGAPCQVTAMSPIWERQTYTLRFDDGATITADDEHRWLAWTTDDLDAGRAPRVATTKQIREQLKRNDRWHWKVPVTSPVQYPEQDYPVHPYVLGVWLGNGDAANSGVTCHKDDRSVVDQCIEIEQGIHGKWQEQGANTLRVKVGTSIEARHQPDTLSKRLKQLGVADNKHIPEQYLRGSIEQRRELLAGLLDTDGTVSREHGNNSRVYFSSTRECLATNTLELVRSLGFKASLISGPIKGYDSTHYRVCFTAREAVFKLPRKLDKQVLDGDRRWTRHRTVREVVPAQSELVRCLAVNSDNHTFLAGRAYTVTHNTQHIAVGATLHAIGTDPTIRSAIVANSGAQAAKTLSSIRRHVETNKKVQEVFPDLKPSPHEGDSWHSMALTVNRPTISKDPTVQAVGVQGSVLGSRLDLIVVDDLLDFENTRTAAARKKTIDWFDSTVLSRLTDHGRVWVIGTPWHPDDLLHVLSERPGWFYQRYSAVLNPRDPTAEWRALWPEQFNVPRLRSISAGMTPINFARSYLCEARSEAAGRFQEEWINACLALGKGLTFRQTPPTGSNGAHYPCYTGVDLALGKNNKSDLSSMFTIAIDEASRRIVCDIQSGRWKAPEIISRMKWAHEHFNSVMIVEDNGAQAFLLQWAVEAGIPVKPFTTTGKNKYDSSFGVESLAVEMRSEMWIIPSGPGGTDLPDEVRAWIRELLFYDPAGHTGDRIMASWFAREGSRHKRPRMRARMLDLSSR